MLLVCLVSALPKTLCCSGLPELVRLSCCLLFRGRLSCPLLLEVVPNQRLPLFQKTLRFPILPNILPAPRPLLHPNTLHCPLVPKILGRQASPGLSRHQEFHQLDPYHWHRNTHSADVCTCHFGKDREYSLAKQYHSR